MSDDHNIIAIWKGPYKNPVGQWVWRFDQAIFRIKQAFSDDRKIAGFVIVAVDNQGNWKVEYSVEHKIMGPRMLAALAKSAITEDLIIENCLKDREERDG